MVYWVMSVLAVLWIIMMWCVVVHVFMRGWGPHIRSRKTAKVEVQAQIKTKHGRKEYCYATQKDEYVHKVLVFECEDGIERDYEVPDRVWDIAMEGDKGVLTYKGELFVDFNSGSAQEDLDAMFARLTRR